MLRHPCQGKQNRKNQANPYKREHSQRFMQVSENVEVGRIVTKEVKRDEEVALPQGAAVPESFQAN